MNNKSLCLNLAQSDTEKDIINLLKNVGYWENDDAWQYYGDYENNYSTMGNQQSKADAAVVEKIINSVDAVLMSECLISGIEPESKHAPQSINDALQKYFGIYNGKLSSIRSTERTRLADKIQFISTGSKSNPCYTIVDKGEGQTPKRMPETLLSLRESNKLRIPFVQGKFNMGGTGVLRFCGKTNLQLIISKRHPNISINEDDNTRNQWGFTIIRRFNPSKKVRSSCYKYLAPNKRILSFSSNSLKLLPGDYPNLFEKELKWGTFIKLYEYQMIGLKTNILWDLNYRLSLLMPNLALPVRMLERRKGYSGHTLETTMSGLSVRLDEDKNKNLEKEFTPPPSSTFSIYEQKMSCQIIVFKRGKEIHYKRNEGIIFTVNGQTHASIDKSFFTRKSVGMSYLKNSLLVIVDCSEIDGRSREDLFMNSRDRLVSGELCSKIEENLSELLKNHPGLRELREIRRREDIENKLEDSKPLVEVIENILKKSPSLSKLFIKGLRITNPFKMKKTKSKMDYKGKRFPTYFKLSKQYPINNPKHCPINIRCRMQYETDAKNDYFDRDIDPGSFSLELNNTQVDSTLNIWNGHATLNVILPKSVKTGEILTFRSIIEDVNHIIEPFIEEFCIEIIDFVDKKKTNKGKRKPPSANRNGDDVDKSDSLSLPNVRLLYHADWTKHSFTRESALKVEDSGENGYDFYINMDNVYLVTEKKSTTKIDPKLLDARYKYGLVLIGLAILKDYELSNNIKKDQDVDNGADIFEKILNFTQIISPILLPLISGLGDLDID